MIIYRHPLFNAFLPKLILLAYYQGKTQPSRRSSLGYVINEQPLTYLSNKIIVLTVLKVSSFHFV